MEEGERRQARIAEEFGLLIFCCGRHTIPPRWYLQIAESRHQATMPENLAHILFSGQDGK
jgi:hypothetical protein